MIIGKKHFILAALILALGTAVYLNWQFSPSESLVAEVADDGADSVISDGAEYVAAVTQTSPSDTAASAEVPVVKETDYFVQARENRESAREESLDTLKEIIDDSSIGEAQKTEAVSAAAKIAENIEKEAAIESLIRAKGYKDCVVVIGETQVNIIIPASDSGLTAADAAIIKDIVVGQINVMPSCIKIIEAK